MSWADCRDLVWCKKLFLTISSSGIVLLFEIAGRLGWNFIAVISFSIIASNTYLPKNYGWSGNMRNEYNILLIFKRRQNHLRVQRCYLFRKDVMGVRCITKSSRGRLEVMLALLPALRLWHYTHNVNQYHWSCYITFQLANRSLQRRDWGLMLTRQLVNDQKCRCF